ncbi:MAG: PEF-CTERM sorting domain-containing protein [Euryarchaeota archaeon]|nr:PEF-CTERM sorting domain-containing protein [Euryarchaeota archaeon]MCG2736344.1 PEF-CTERM sorting domain-containing protein [Candidatus Methanoperedenaceae archaeon]
MRNKIVIIALVLAVMAAMMGTASAYYTDVDDFTCKDGNGQSIECLKASFDIPDTKIAATAKNLVDNQCYQIRYYQPNTLLDVFTENDLYPKPGTLAPYSSSNPLGFHLGPKFTDNPHSESLNDPPVDHWTQGLWKVLLMKGGKDTSGGCTDATTILTSIKVNVPVDIPIPEFSTVAIPIAAVLGLVFLFQHRKRKEE